MSIKDKIFNKMADFMYKYKSDDMDQIKFCNVNGRIKSATITKSDEFLKENKDKQVSGLIDVDKLLTEEIINNEMRSIVFCDNGRVVCLTNQLGANYIETSHEFFELANESVFIMFNSKQDYNSMKDYISQSSKWHNFMIVEEEIPHLNSFEKLFNIGAKNSNKEEQAEKDQEDRKGEIHEKELVKGDKRLNENIIQLDGIITNKSQTFLKKDNKPAKYLYVTQEDIYNGKKKKYTLIVSLDDKLLDDYGDEIKVGDKVSVTGKLISYLDKNDNTQFIINSFDFEILERSNKKNNNTEIER